VNYFVSPLLALIQTNFNISSSKLSFFPLSISGPLLLSLLSLFIYRESLLETLLGGLIRTLGLWGRILALNVTCPIEKSMTGQPFLASFCNGFTHHFSMEKSGDGWRGRRGCQGREWLFFFFGHVRECGRKDMSWTCTKTVSFWCFFFFKTASFLLQEEVSFKKSCSSKLVDFSV